jgi:hypothetical protein
MQRLFELLLPRADDGISPVRYLSSLCCSEFPPDLRVLYFALNFHEQSARLSCWAKLAEIATIAAEDPTLFRGFETCRLSIPTRLPAGNR